ncbi:MAG: histidine phosphatase family protein [Syntrophothermus sp.]
MTTFYIIRHGNTTAGNMISGRTPGFHLSENGRMQAEQLAERISHIGFDAIYASPMERTQETASYLARRTDKKVETLESLIEVDFGRWTGKSFDELESDKVWKLFHTFRSGTPVPGGESMVDVQTRMITEIDRLRHKHPRQTVAIVSHGDPIRCTITYYAGIPLEMMLRINISTASVSIIEVEDWGARIHCINESGDIPELRKQR